ncbi:bifunctional DNA primase/polymerase [Haloglycomyces albus]|uniref:bifunctional DNA primase/polymerase n=1 Tax=Haloglycomyces albus TaxID=526067 RepID=UPI0004B8DD1B|nr:bifunctional DNA primase/polymerase [Haloglycomyces albus]
MPASSTMSPTNTAPSEQEMKPRPIVDWALAAARRGWPVFPLKQGEKRPALSNWETAATTDPARVRNWWERTPAANYGIACGPAGLVVVDCDLAKPAKDGTYPYGRDDGVDRFLAFAEAWGETALPHTFTVQTGSGGWHFYYQQRNDDRPLRNTTGRLCPFVDTRASGGYVVGPGSIVHGATYQLANKEEAAPLPEWTRTFLRALSEAETTRGGESVPSQWSLTAVGRGSNGRLKRYAHSALDSTVEKIAAAHPGYRNNMLGGGAESIGQLVAGGLLDEAEARSALTNAAIACGLDSDSGRGGGTACGLAGIDKTITSGFRRGAKHPRTGPHT